MLPRLSPQENVALEATPKWIRAYAKGSLIADSRQACIARGEHPPPRAYAFPEADVRKPWPDGAFEVDGHVVIPWDAADRWLEESEEVFIHPRDPKSRIDVLHSARHIQVHVDGMRVADTRQAVVLIEAHPFLPVRYYIPADDVALDMLRPSDTVTGCPYKGWATYHHVDTGKLHEDIVWTYRSPFREVDPIRGRYCFFNEKVDIVVDGEPQPRPKTPFS